MEGGGGGDEGGGYVAFAARILANKTSTPLRPSPAMARNVKGEDSGGVTGVEGVDEWGQVGGGGGWRFTSST
jgi:hypothetical protein